MRFKKALVFWVAWVIFLFCTAAGAVEVTPFFQIAKDYDANPIKANKRWINATVCIEGDIRHIGVDEKGNAQIAFMKMTEDLEEAVVVYVFSFNGVPEELAELEKWQTVKIIGRVTEISREEGNVDGHTLIGLAINVSLAHLVIQ